MNGASWRKNMEKTKKAFIVRVVAIFILSNLSSLMIGTYLAEPVLTQQTSETTINRPDYSEISLSLDVKVHLDLKTPYTLTSTANNIYIPYVFFVREVQENQDEFNGFNMNQAAGREIVISVPKKYIAKILRTKSLRLLPQLPRELLLTKSKGRTYEINY